MLVKYHLSDFFERRVKRSNEDFCKRTGEYKEGVSLRALSEWDGLSLDLTKIRAPAFIRASEIRGCEAELAQH